MTRENKIDADIAEDESWWLDHIRSSIAEGWSLALVKDCMTVHVPERVHPHVLASTAESKCDFCDHCHEVNEACIRCGNRP